MEEEVNYSTVVFKNGRQSSKEKKEDATIYAEVKHEGKDAAPAPLQEEAGAASHSRLLLLCLCFLSVVLIGSIGAIIYVSVSLRDYAAENKKLTQERSNLQTKNEELDKQKKILENQTAEISRERENFNRTLEVIKKFTNFPVDEYCPEKKCGPCRKGWIQYQNKCYLFNEDGPWKSWSASRQYCKDRSADLVVVDDLQEQEFLHNNTRFYFDVHHGYWMGLQRTGDKWVWIDGHEDKLMLWKNLNPKPKDYGLMMPRSNLTHTWNSGDDGFQNKFICEDDKVLMWSN